MDDTLILASVNTVTRAVARANLQVGLVLNRIRRLGLKVAANKTEVLIFHGKKKPVNPPPVQVGAELIHPGSTMKYLGIIFDGKLSFKNHFEHIESKTAGVVRALGSLMPNLRGPGEARRRLYASILLSVILYGAPVWSEALVASRKSLMLLNRVIRTMAIRVISAYRTVSLGAATLMAGIPRLCLLASMRRRVYDRVWDLREGGTWTKIRAAEIRAEEELLMRRQWKIYMSNPNPSGLKTRMAILPVFEDWLDRGHGGLTFRITQLLTGHGSFGTFLYRIGKAESPHCTHCAERVEDSASHTL